MPEPQEWRVTVVVDSREAAAKLAAWLGTYGFDPAIAPYFGRTGPVKLG